jgi:hypothetical protein
MQLLNRLSSYCILQSAFALICHSQRVQRDSTTNSTEKDKTMDGHFLGSCIVKLWLYGMPKCYMAQQPSVFTSPWKPQILQLLLMPFVV